MSGISFSSLRAGHRYWVVNFGEKIEFEIVEVLDPLDFKIKDLTSLEIFRLSEITQYGRGKDFEIRDLA